MTNVLAEDEETEYEKEVHDPNLPEFETKRRVGHWWVALHITPVA